ncbi:hypothetical protein B0T20DRAFT_78392 [Sordaria brevicollis]|uniref:NAD-dependent epimerase/dehydratase domain-containing protein n=1 Tax=Sordaria brevicollis TaxID=83679 RepID=A0AAE0P194_SORBR|nr:hypothetical protein B0T20DRAFT_78392 [Sordaria brevicollis]
MASSPPSTRPQTVLVTGSSGHLGRALMLSLPSLGYRPIGIDIKASETATFIGSFGDASLLQNLFTPSWLRAQSSLDPQIEPISHIIHCATLHKPHIESHTKVQFVQTNIADTLTLLEAAAATTTDPSTSDSNADSEKTVIKSFTYISTTSTFGRSLIPLSSTSSKPKAVHITEQTPCLPKNIYGLTKSSAEDLCYLISSQSPLPVVILKTSRFFPEADDDEDRRASLGDENLKLCELAYRRVDIEDIVRACVASMNAQTYPEEGKRRKYGKYIISGPSPFLDLGEEDWVRLNEKGPEGAEKVMAEVAERLCPGVGKVMEERGWKWLSRVDRVYDSRLAMKDVESGGLGWKPDYTFQKALERISRGEEWRSELTAKVGKLGYHDRAWGVYTTE